MTPVENLESLDSYLHEVSDIDQIVPVKGKAYSDFKVARISTKPNDLKSDIRSEGMASFRGPDGVGNYWGAIDQHWEIPIPTLWTVFTGDYSFLNFDLIIKFSDASWQPDSRKPDNFIWDINIGNVLEKTVPYFINFRHIDSGVWRLFIRQSGVFSHAGKIRIGMRLNMMWETGQPQNISYWSALVTSFLSLTSQFRVVSTLDFSEGSPPISASLSTLVPTKEEEKDEIQIKPSSLEEKDEIQIGSSSSLSVSPSSFVLFDAED